MLLVYNLLSQTGIIPRLLLGAGLIKDQSQFLSILYDKKGIGIIISYLWKEIPFGLGQAFNYENIILFN